MELSFLKRLKNNREQAGISIRKSFIAFAVGMLLLILSIAAITAFTYRAFIVDLQAYSSRMTSLNDFVEYLRKENECFALAVVRRTNETDTDYTTAHLQTQSLLAQVQHMFNDRSETEVRLLFQAIEETYHSYTQLCEEVFYLQSNGFSHILVYYDALTAVSYCNTYTTQLSRINADNGMRICSTTISLMSACLIICFIASTVGVIITIAFWKYAGGNLIRPLGELTDEATHISENQLDLPDIERTNNQEMNRLIAGFNRMKNSMQQSLLHLQQINRMETELHQKEIEKIETERLLEQAQLGMLRSQLNPHFLFNTLNIIASMSEIEQAQTTRDLIMSLAELFRYNLKNLQDMTTLAEEVQICHKYISIQKIRFGKRISFAVDCHPMALPCLIPIFTLQPLVENAVIHGMRDREENGQVRIRIRRYENLVTIRVTDNGIGISRDKADRIFSEPTQGDTSGIGLSTVKKRIEMSCCNGTLIMRSIPRLGTTVLVSFQV